jgi:4-diphosphocytidyl-2-C-methyl-D-erythritol kinase
MPFGGSRSVSENPQRVNIQAPAKINLGLRVLGKRPDGYHEIETLFIAVSLFDVITFERRIRGGVTLTWEKGRDDLNPGDFAVDERNLILRAARRFEEEVGRRLDVGIHIKKTIPVAAGLGGGSADAAATLVGLGTLFPDFADRVDLSHLAANLGADVPFFLGRPSAIGRGRGELLIPLTIDISWYAIVICPYVASPTPAVYAALDLTCLPKMPHFPARLEGDGFFAALALIHNDLQDVVERRVPQVLHWKNRLLTLGAEGAYVSGSGPSVFGVFRQKPDSAMLESIRAEGVDAFLVRPLDTKSALVIGLS